MNNRHKSFLFKNKKMFYVILKMRILNKNKGTMIIIPTYYWL